jgi:hypothetical protein
VLQYILSRIKKEENCNDFGNGKEKRANAPVSLWLVLIYELVRFVFSNSAAESYRPKEQLLRNFSTNYTDSCLVQTVVPVQWKGGQVSTSTLSYFLEPATQSARS